MITSAAVVVITIKRLLFAVQFFKYIHLTNTKQMRLNG